MRKFVQFTLSLLIGGVLLWLSFRRVDLRESLGVLLRAPWWLYLAYLASLMLTHVFRSERYRLQLRRMTGHPIAFTEAFAIFSVGVAATFLIPFRLGEFVRPYLNKARGHLSMSAGLSTVAAERVIDGLTTTAMLGIVLLLMRGRAIPDVVFVAGNVALLVFGGSCVVFVIGYKKREWSVRVFHRLLTVFSTALAERLAGMLDRFLAGLNTLPSWRDLALYELYTLGYWLVNGATMYMVMVGMGIEVDWIGGFFVLSCLVIGVMIPAPPGNVGNFEYAIVLPLTTLGVGHNIAAAYAVAIHLMQAAQMTLTALIFIANGRISMRRVVEATQGRGQDDEGTAS